MSNRKKSRVDKTAEDYERPEWDWISKKDLD